MYFGKEQCFGELNLFVFSQRLIHPFTAKLYDNSQQFALLHIIPTSQSDTFFPGDAAQVCEIEGNEFSCSTADASINATCDRERCPLQGPPMAPIMESQLLTGSAKKDLNQEERDVLYLNQTQNWY